MGFLWSLLVVTLYFFLYRTTHLLLSSIGLFFCDSLESSGAIYKATHDNASKKYIRIYKATHDNASKKYIVYCLKVDDCLEKVFYS